jgi:multicomponent Na+:H+ antiporter subunit E
VKRLAGFLVLLSFWLVLSGHYDLFHIGWGIVSAAVVTFFSVGLTSLNTDRQDRLRFWGLVSYLPWLLLQVVLANLHVAYLVLRPTAIRPQIIRVKTRLSGDLAKTILGNSITLTPGTITMDIQDDELIVHALSEKVARELADGEMERRVARIFQEPGE